MITTGKKSRPVQRPQVRDFFHHAQQTGIAPRIRADGAGISRVDVAAYAAGDEARLHRLERADQRLQSRLAALQHRSEEHTSELQSLMRISYAVFCLKKKNKSRNI